MEAATKTYDRFKLFWRAADPDFATTIFRAMVIGPSISGACSYVPARADLQAIDGLWCRLGQRVLLARRPATVRGHLVAPSYSEANKSLKFVDASTELRIGRLRWYQSMSKSPQLYQQWLLAVFG